MNDKIKKLINGWDNENDEEKNNDIIEFINSLITEKKYDIEAEYKRKIHGMIMVAEMRIDEIKKTKPKLIKILKFEQNQNKTVNHEISYRIKKISEEQSNCKTSTIGEVKKECISDSCIEQKENILKDIYNKDNDKPEEKNTELLDDIKCDDQYLESEKGIIHKKEDIISDISDVSDNKSTNNYNDAINAVTEPCIKTLECINENDNKCTQTTKSKYNIKTLKSANDSHISPGSNEVHNNKTSAKIKTEEASYNVKTLKSVNDSRISSGSGTVDNNISPKTQTRETNYNIKMLKNNNKKFRL